MIHHLVLYIHYFVNIFSIQVHNTHNSIPQQIVLTHHQADDDFDPISCRPGLHSGQTTITYKESEHILKYLTMLYQTLTTLTPSSSQHPFQQSINFIANTPTIGPNKSKMGTNSIKKMYGEQSKYDVNDIHKSRLPTCSMRN